jgi:hypothetical protein
MTKIILLLICIVILFAAGGCVSANVTGVDHTEYPGDLDHGEPSK